MQPMMGPFVEPVNMFRKGANVKIISCRAQSDQSTLNTVCKVVSGHTNDWGTVYTLSDGKYYFHNDITGA